MKIHIPNTAWLGNIDRFLTLFDETNQQTLEITAHKQWISVHPVVLAMVAALGLSCRPEHIACEEIEARSRHYLKRMNLFDLLHIPSDITIVEHESAGRFIPLTQITNSETLSTFMTDMIPLLHVSPEHAKSIRYVMSELVRNVFEHSNSDIGAILCAQYYKKTNRISIGIVDRGMGIQRSIAESYQVNSDAEALQLALTPGITGTTRQIGGTDYNAGAGLFFIKSIAKANKDFFVLYSGDTLYKLLKTPANRTVRLYGDPYKDKHSLKTGLPYWQGTVVGIDISLDNKEMFSLLLDMIRNSYTKTIRDRRKELYKKPRFI
jgi:anti-sigma regulatory factor (Ser/Thr protein kinase)